MKRSGGLGGRPRRYKRSRRGDWYREIDFATQFYCSKWALRRARRSNEWSIEVWHEILTLGYKSTLSRVTNAESKSLHHRIHICAYTQVRRIFKRCVSSFATFTHLSSDRISNPAYLKRTVPKAQFYEKIREYKIDEHEKMNVNFTTLFAHNPYGFEKRIFANGSIMHNHVACIINDGDADQTRDTRIAVINRERFHANYKQRKL